jgi:hypothetical protein
VITNYCVCKPEQFLNKFTGKIYLFFRKLKQFDFLRNKKEKNRKIKTQKTWKGLLFREDSNPSLSKLYSTSDKSN